MRLVIDAIGNRSGGGLRVLEQTLDAVSRLPLAHVTVLTSPGVDLPWRERVTLLPAPWAQPLPGRLAWVMAQQAAWVERLRPQVWLALNGMALGLPRGPGSPALAVLMQQPLPLYPEALRDEPLTLVARMALMRGLMHATCARASLVFTQTQHMRAALLRAFGLSPARVVVACPGLTWPLASPRGPDRSPAAAPGAPPRLLYVGHHSPYKDVALLPALMRRLWRRHPQALLEVTGRPAWAHALGDARVRCLGELDAQGVRAALARAHLTLMPSRAESFGLPLLEAMSQGCPVLAPARPGDARAWADAAAGLLNDPWRWAARSAAGVARARELQALGGPDLMASRLADLAHAQGGLSWS